MSVCKPLLQLLCRHVGLQKSFHSFALTVPSAEREHQALHHTSGTHLKMCVNTRRGPRQGRVVDANK